MRASPEAPALPRLHLVTDDAVLRRPTFERQVDELLTAGGARLALHIRGRGLNGRTLWERASFCSEIAIRSGSWLFINDRVDVALGCDAAGVQLGRESFPIPPVRRLLGADRWIGASVHDVPAALAAAADGADFVLAGTLFESPSHPGTPGSGPGWLGDVSGAAVPVIGIGGITPSRTAEVLRAGAYGVAVIRGVWHANSPARALEEYLRELE